MDDAELLATHALAFLAEDSRLLDRFLGESGIGLANLRAASAESGFLSGVLEFLLGDEAALIAFADREGIPPDRIAAAHRLLADNPHDHSA